MKAKKENLFYVDARDIVKDIHFKVVTDTPFNANVVTHFYEFEDHTLDYELIELMGLGVVRNLHFDNDYYVYNASDEQMDNRFRVANETLRIGVYYQITHPDYDDRDLEKLIFKTPGGKEYLTLLQTRDTNQVLNRLKEIFDRKKGQVINLKY